MFFFLKASRVACRDEIRCRKKKQKPLLFFFFLELVFVNRIQENMSVIVLSFNYYDANTFPFHFAQFPFSFITTDPQCLQFFVSLRMIFYSYSPHLKGICNFAWLVIRLLLVWCKRKISLWISVSANKPIYIFILMRKTVMQSFRSSCRRIHSTSTHSPRRRVFPIIPIILYCAKIWCLSLSLPLSLLSFLSFFYFSYC